MESALQSLSGLETCRGAFVPSAPYLVCHWLQVSKVGPVQGGEREQCSSWASRVRRPQSPEDSSPPKAAVNNYSEKFLQPVERTEP